MSAQRDRGTEPGTCPEHISAERDPPTCWKALITTAQPRLPIEATAGHPRRHTAVRRKGVACAPQLPGPHGCWSLWDRSPNTTPVTGLGRSCKYPGGQTLLTGTYHTNGQIARPRTYGLLTPLSTHPINKEPPRAPSLCQACAGHWECPRERDRLSPPPEAHRLAWVTAGASEHPKKRITVFSGSRGKTRG